MTTLVRSSAGFQVPQVKLASPLETKIKTATFLLGSYLTEPICKSHEYYRSISIVDSMHPRASKVANFGRKFFLILGMMGWGAMGLLTTLPGIILRSAGASLENNPYITSTTTPHPIPANRQVSLLSWNVCCVGAGYPITDGGVTPREYRYDDIVAKIVLSNADIICLYEVFDVATGQYFKDKLEKQGYSHFYYNIGPRAVGVSSAMMVASRYEIGDPEFTAFPKSTLVGRTKNAEKGVFAFSLLENNKRLIRILSTHPQHSEEPSFPTQAEVIGRGQQMKIIQGIADKILDVPVVITGDLNMADEELDNLDCFKDFDHGDLQLGEPTWGGDYWCATLMNKRVSLPQNLDHILGKKVGLVTRIAFDTGYDDKVFQKSAISDHAPLLATFTV